MEQIYVRYLELLGLEKRFFPTKHYVYLLMVKWSDLTEKLVYRTYPEMHTFHKSLKEMFPIEAGEIEKRDRIIPSLPAPRWVDSQKSRENRKSTLSDYCHALVQLPPHISRCKLLSDFFRVRRDDENPPAPNPLNRSETFVESRELARGVASEISAPILLDTYRVIADFQKTSKHELSVSDDDLVEIVEKNPNGWWFCQSGSNRGWIPASYLEPLDGPDEAEDAEPDYEGEPHISVQAYRAEQDDEISLEVGETVSVIHKLLDGWWVVRRGDQTGHFPSMFLQKSGNQESQSINPRGQKPPPRRSTIRNAKSIHNKPRQRLSQDTYRRNSRRFLQQKKNSSGRRPPKSPLTERKNQENIPESSSSDTEQKKEVPPVPPRPSTELIMERCTISTCKKVSVHMSQEAS
ncbi:neutrophil cytosol factor 1 [Gouania willdenowi]|uniref:Neutrophil cytosolic factor 1 n=1 Tax=Gouania willdenowi TaxID=441366 RepID=A0A8C5DVR2_GOUWI|nr:neutrophil cytosol factor 1 [Gouania willdenowi]